MGNGAKTTRPLRSAGCILNRILRPQGALVKALILDGSESGDETAKRLLLLLGETLGNHGLESESIFLRDKHIAPCVGCFNCWLKTPGLCVVADDAREVSRAMIRSDLLIFFSPVTFGGYSWQLKKALDRSICLISPAFTKIGGEVHHKPRYPRYPRLLGIGVAQRNNPESARIFCNLVTRNAINLQAPAHAAAVLHDDAPAEIRAQLKALFGGAGGKSMSEERKVLLLVGSGRPRSTSESLGSYLIGQLQGRGFRSETLWLYRVLKSAENTCQLLAAVAACDLLVLSTPLFVDSLPAPVIQALETMAQHRLENPPRKLQRMVAIVNSGFPEAHQNQTALAICRQFALETGFEWAGGLPLGGGAAIDGRPLPQAGMARHARQALELTAVALANGEATPKQAVDLISKPMFPVWLYMLFGTLGWRRKARKYGAIDHVDAHPFIP